MRTVSIIIITFTAITLVSFLKSGSVKNTWEDFSVPKIVKPIFMRLTKSKNQTAEKKSVKENSDAAVEDKSISSKVNSSKEANTEEKDDNKKSALEKIIRYEKIEEGTSTEQKGPSVGKTALERVMQGQVNESDYQQKKPIKSEEVESALQRVLDGKIEEKQE